MFGICFWLSELCLQQAEANINSAKLLAKLDEISSGGKLPNYFPPQQLSLMSNSNTLYSGLQNRRCTVSAYKAYLIFIIGIRNLLFKNFLCL
jgi:hypothetical protein